MSNVFDVQVSSRAFIIQRLLETILEIDDITL